MTIKALGIDVQRGNYVCKVLGPNTIGVAKSTPLDDNFKREPMDKLRRLLSSFKFKIDKKTRGVLPDNVTLMIDPNDRNSIRNTVREIEDLLDLYKTTLHLDNSTHKQLTEIISYIKKNGVVCGYSIGRLLRIYDSMFITSILSPKE